MEDKLKEIIETQEGLINKYDIQRDRRHYQMLFMREHNFNNELKYLEIQQDAVSDIFVDYRNAIEDLRKLLNAWVNDYAVCKVIRKLKERIEELEKKLLTFTSKTT